MYLMYGLLPLGGKGLGNALSPFGDSTSAPVHRLLPRAGAQPVRLELVGPAHPNRAHVEAFVRETFARHYGARLGALPRQLACLLDARGQLCAVAGIRPAAQGPLFLEQYLDRPVHEYLVTDRTPAPERRHIMEIGNLAATEPGQFRFVLIALSAYLYSAGFQWVVCTARASLRNTLARMGLSPVVLGAADPARLGAAATRWGSYYHGRPQVIAGELEPAAGLLAARFAHRDNPVHELWHSASELGRARRIGCLGPVRIVGRSRLVGTVGA